MSPALITCLRLRQVPRDPEGPDGAGRGEAAHPQGGVRSVEESPAGTPSPVRMCKHIQMWTFGFKCGHLGSNVARLSAASQMIAVLVDKMIRTQIVDCAAVANWLFSQDMAHEFTR